MEKILNSIVTQSRGLAGTITRARITEYLQAGNQAEDFPSTLSRQETIRLARVGTLLADPMFDQTIDSGRVTFAMIRPRLELGQSRGSDSEIAEEILSKIKGRFRVVFNLPWPISLDAFTEFYKPVKDTLLGMPQADPDGAPNNVWDLFAKYGTEGATSLLILDAHKLQRQTGHQTWQLWRTFIGATIPQNALPGTLRHDYGSVYNNIVHGSDSVKSVHSEISWLRKQIYTHQ